MTKESACIHLKESLLCKGLTEAAPYSMDVIIACAIFLVVSAIVVCGLFYFFGLIGRKYGKIDNDRLRCMTQAEIDKRR
jgi:hypothetical protein